MTTMMEVVHCHVHTPVTKRTHPGDAIPSEDDADLVVADVASCSFLFLPDVFLHELIGAFLQIEGHYYTSSVRELRWPVLSVAIFPNCPRRCCISSGLSSAYPQNDSIDHPLSMPFFQFTVEDHLGKRSILTTWLD